MSRTRRRNKDYPPKTDPAEFGGGRRRGFYMTADLRGVLCSRAGCGREAYASWGACADGNVQRPVCPEDDVRLNALALAFMGDPDAPAKLSRYVAEVEQRAGRTVDVTLALAIAVEAAADYLEGVPV